jgi:uncharacterized protein YcfL
MNIIRRTSLPLAAFLLTACGVSSPYPVYSIENDTELASTVVAGEPSLAAVVRAGRARLDRVADNRLKLSVPIRNISDEAIQVLVQIVWRDRQQLSLGDESNRQVMTIPGGGTVEFVSTSRSDAADNYVVRLFWNK